MQLNKYLIFIFSIVLFVSCKPSYTRNQTILKAEKKLYTCPDSAYKLLCSIKKPQQLPEADYAAWCLHYTHARYKLYIDEKSDYRIRFASDYYQKNGPDKYAGTALYLQGCLAMIKSKNSISMKYYKKAIDYLEHTNEYTTLGLTYSKISHIYILEEFYSESIKNIDLATKCFQKSKNDVYIYYAYRTKAECLYRLKKPIKTITYEISKSEKLALINNDSNFYNEIIRFKGKINIDSNTQFAKECFLLGNKGSKFDNRNTNVFLSYIYSKLQMSDSAKYYLEKSKVDSNDIKSIWLNEVSNSYLMKSNGNFDSAFIYLEMAYNTRDKFFLKENKELLVRIDKQYDYTKKEHERSLLEIANREKIIVITILIVVLLIVLLIHFQIKNKHKLKQNKLELEQQTLKYQIEKQENENTQNIKLLKANILNRIDNTLKFKRLQTGLINKLKVDEFRNEITQQVIIPESELHLYMNNADKLFNNRISDLKNEFPEVTTNDLILISLICLGMNLNNCCILLDMSLNTLYARRKRLRAHLCIDKNADIDKWILQKIVGKVTE